jgi:hypothetical protein
MNALHLPERLAAGLRSDKSAASRMANEHLARYQDFHRPIRHGFADSQLPTGLCGGQVRLTHAQTAQLDVFLHAFGQPMGLRRTDVSSCIHDNH